MNALKSKKGMTLVEIIVAITILGIIIVSILNMFNFSITEIFSSGFRTDASLEVQQLADDLQTENNTNPMDTSELATFMNNKGYKAVASIDLLAVKQTGFDGNYYIGTGSIEGVQGGEISIAKFYNNGKRTVRITTYLIGDDII